MLIANILVPDITAHFQISHGVHALTTPLSFFAPFFIISSGTFSKKQNERDF